MRIAGTLDLDGSTVKLDQGGNATTITSNSPSGDITLTLPSTTDTVVGRATSDTLTNKILTAPEITAGSTLDTDSSGTLAIGGTNATTITIGRSGQTVTIAGDLNVSGNLDVNEVQDDTFTIVDEGDETKTLVFSLGGATTSTKTTLVASQSADRSITFPDATDTLVGKATTDTLTNKTLTSPVLTTPQINDTSSDHQYIFASSELLADRTVTLPLLTGNDTFVFQAHTQTLTNKTLTSPVLTTPTLTSGSNFTFTGQGELRLADSSGGEYAGFVSPATITTYTIEVPDAGPTANSQVLCITDYTSDPITTEWASALTSTLSDQNMFIGNSSNVSTAVDTDLEGEIEAFATSLTFVDGDVSLTNDTITSTSHGLYNGQRIYMTTTGTLPTGLSASTEYYVTGVTSNTFTLASSMANALAGTAVNITAASGGGTHTVQTGGLQPKVSSMIRTPTMTVPHISDSSDITKDLTFALSGATTAKTMTITSSHSDDRTLTLPDATDTLVGLATTDTLTNKTLTSPVLTTPQINDTSSDHQYIFASSELLADRTVTLPLLTGNDTFVFEAHTQTLTNKTLTTPNLGLPVITDTTDTSKTIEFTIAAAATAKTLTIDTQHSDNRTITMPDASTTLVGTDTSQTLSSKTLSSPTVSGTVTLSSTPTYSGAVLFSGGSISLDNAVTINESGADVDFRVEGDTITNLLLVDAGADKVGIGGTPLDKFHVFETASGSFAQRITPSHASAPYGLDIHFSGGNQSASGTTYARGRDTVGTKWAFGSNGGLSNFQSNDSDLSDERVKNSIALLEESAINVINKLKVKTFTYMGNDDIPCTGLIAQDVEKVKPEWMSTFDTKDKDGNEIEAKSIRNKEIMFYMLKAIQELSAEVESIKNV